MLGDSGTAAKLEPHIIDSFSSSGTKTVYFVGGAGVIGSDALKMMERTGSKVIRLERAARGETAFQ
ncbi:MAG: hypothetical protein SPK50_05210 [Mobiluncus porci]|uniref:Uncharacterized protein n=1 Tax=Mobiluncus porci TaxID=2652278 RepID=A0A7K0K112_9ACTO|nr:MULTISPECIES: hypothetical protein [Mobiluncus]MCI6584634.1 hypothetical protein [Mobiluncus sp.]MDD7541525.1 hypothetical protein [Mobiluncus porci]MDY5748510.1 hypothetical protein [Mobiluncus porci]MST48730.1 hypothetical protein [Mobiluncus porci]